MKKSDQHDNFSYKKSQLVKKVTNMTIFYYKKSQPNEKSHQHDNFCYKKSLLSEQTHLKTHKLENICYYHLLKKKLPNWKLLL